MEPSPREGSSSPFHRRSATLLSRTSSQVGQSSYSGVYTMKILRYVIMAGLVLGISNFSHAFNWTLNDPPDANSPFFQVTPGVPFSFVFADCSFPIGGITYTGCATGQNVGNVTLTNIDFSFANTDALDGAQPNCLSNAFSDLSCNLTPDGNEYVLTFNDACGSQTCGIPPGNFFQIFEDAVPGSQFPT